MTDNYTNALTEMLSFK